MANSLFNREVKEGRGQSVKVLSEESNAILTIDGSLDAPEVIREYTQIVPTEEKTEDAEYIDPAEYNKRSSGVMPDLGAVLAGAIGGESATATDVIKSLVTVDDESDLPIKGVIPNPAAFAAAEILADYNDSLGLDEVGVMLRRLTVWKAKYGCGEKGRRATEAFKALAGEKEKEFQIEKEMKGVAGK